MLKHNSKPNLKSMFDRIFRISIGHTPLLLDHFILVGDLVSTTIRKSCGYAGRRMKTAIEAVSKAIALPICQKLKEAVVETIAIPRMAYGTQWCMPSKASAAQLRSKVLNLIWGPNGKIRCQEVVLGILHDATRIDPTFACAARAILVARRMIMKSPKRYERLIATFKKAIDERRSEDIPGPAHGLAKAIAIFDANLVVHRDKLVIVFPTGTKLSLHV